MKYAPLVIALCAAVFWGCDDGSSSSSGASCRALSGVSHIVQAANSHASGRPSHLPRALKKFKDQGKFDGSKKIPITVSLNLNNPSDLEKKLVEMYTPGDPNYGHFMTPDEFRLRYSPAQEQIAKLGAYLASKGVQDITVNANRYFISGVASVQALDTMLKMEIHQYKDAKGETYFAPSSEPVIPAGFDIQAIHGLHNISKWHPHSASLAGSGHSGGLSASDVRGAYNLNISGVDGTGQTLGLFELDAYNASDLTTYEQYNGLPNVSVTPINVDRGSTSSPGGGQAEVTLDIELMMAVAPGAKILVYEGANSDTGILATYSKIANDDLAKSVSTSWGSSEDSTSNSLIQAENTVFMQMAAQGQSIFSAAGDAGAYDNGSSLSIDDPSGQPYMTAVGGTRLNSNGATYVSETTWSGGGGGVSSVWSIPAYQAGVATSSNKASSQMRNIPDVSLESDMNTGYDIYEGGSWGTWGGTSCAAPIWAAFTALVNQQRGDMGPIGFINPYLYAVGKSGNYGSDFHDIADGSTNGYYPATSGFDDATGWGSMNGLNLFQDLSWGAIAPTGC